jgi:benzoyl-CoA reductase subunit C
MNEQERAAADKTHDPAGHLLEEARKRLIDNGLAPVNAWKEENPEGLAVGHLPIYTPRPVLEAIGALPVAVFGGGDRDIIKGDSFFQSYICHIPRSTVEMGMNGAFDDLDGMIFPSICDVVRNLSGMWQMLFPEVYATYLDLPQNFDPNVGGRFYIQEMTRIARELEARGAKSLDPESLERAIRDENARRNALFRLSELRRAESWRVPASEAYLITRAGGAMMARDHADFIGRYLEAVQMRQGQPRDNVRVVLTGAFCEQPPLGLIVSLERSGCDIIDDDFQLGFHTVDGDIDEGTGDPMAALARAFTEKGRDTASRYVADEEKGRALIERVEACSADGVIFAAASFCDPALLDQPMLERALTDANVPFTSFKFAENTGQFHVIREQAGAFSDAVRLWGAAA